MNLFEKLSALDFITVLDLEEQITTEMNVINAVEMNGSCYLLVTIPEDLLSDDDEDEETEEEIEDAYVFKVCKEDEAEFLVTEDYSDLEVYVTTDIPAKEFEEAGRLLSESDDYELKIESDNND